MYIKNLILSAALLPLIIAGCGSNGNLAVALNSDIIPVASSQPVVNSLPEAVETPVSRATSNPPVIISTPASTIAPIQALKQTAYQAFQKRLNEAKADITPDFYKRDFDSEIAQHQREFNQGQISEKQYNYYQMDYYVNVTINMENGLNTMDVSNPHNIPEIDQINATARHQIQQLIDMAYSQFVFYYLKNNP